MESCEATTSCDNSNTMTDKNQTNDVVSKPHETTLFEINFSDVALLRESYTIIETPGLENQLCILETSSPIYKLMVSLQNEENTRKFLEFCEIEKDDSTELLRLILHNVQLKPTIRADGKEVIAGASLGIIQIMHKFLLRVYSINAQHHTQEDSATFAKHNTATQEFIKTTYSIENMSAPDFRTFLKLFLHTDTGVEEIMNCFKEHESVTKRIFTELSRASMSGAMLLKEQEFSKKKLLVENDECNDVGTVSEDDQQMNCDGPETKSSSGKEKAEAMEVESEDVSNNKPLVIEESYELHESELEELRKKCECLPQNAQRYCREISSEFILQLVLNIHGFYKRHLAQLKMGHQVLVLIDCLAELGYSMEATLSSKDVGLLHASSKDRATTLVNLLLQGLMLVLTLYDLNDDNNTGTRAYIMNYFALLLATMTSNFNNNKDC